MTQEPNDQIVKGIEQLLFNAEVLRGGGDTGPVDLSAIPTEYKKAVAKLLRSRFNEELAVMKQGDDIGDADHVTSAAAAIDANLACRLDDRRILHFAVHELLGTSTWDMRHTDDLAQLPLPERIDEITRHLDEPWQREHGAVTAENVREKLHWIAQRLGLDKGEQD